MSDLADRGTSADHAEDWRHRAACRDADDPELWQPLGTTSAYDEQVAEAKAVCFACPVREACLAWALEQREPEGIWGGLTAEERANRRRREQKRKQTHCRYNHDIAVVGRDVSGSCSECRRERDRKRDAVRRQQAREQGRSA